MKDYMLIDATKKNCRGIVAELEKAIKIIDKGEEIEAVVYGIPNKVDVYAWARRKGHLIKEEKREGQNFRLTVIKETN